MVWKSTLYVIVNVVFHSRKIITPFFLRSFSLLLCPKLGNLITYSTVTESVAVGVSFCKGLTSYSMDNNIYNLGGLALAYLELYARGSGGS